MNCLGDCDRPGCPVCDRSTACSHCGRYLGGEATFELRFQPEPRARRQAGRDLVTRQLCAVCASDIFRGVVFAGRLLSIVLAAGGRTSVGVLCSMEEAYRARHRRDRERERASEASDDDIPF